MKFTLLCLLVLGFMACSKDNNTDDKGTVNATTGSRHVTARGADGDMHSVVIDVDGYLLEGFEGKIPASAKNCLSRRNDGWGVCCPRGTGPSYIAGMEGGYTCTPEDKTGGLTEFQEKMADYTKYRQAGPGYIH